MQWKNAVKISRFVGFLVVSMHLQAATSVTFQSENDLQRALEPFSFEEVVLRMSKAKAFDTLSFEYGRETNPNRTIPMRNSEIGNLLKSEVWKTKFLTVFYPESPRVPHHVTIAFNRSTKGISDVSVEEDAELFATIKKIAEIYKTISIQG